MAERVIRRTGSSSRPAFIPYSEAYATGFEDMRRRVPDTSRSQTLLGWPPTIALDEIIDNVAESYRAAQATSA